MEARLFLRGEGKLDDLLCTVPADAGGHTGEESRLAVLAVQLHTGGHDGLLIEADQLHQLRRRHGDGILGAVLAVVGGPAALPGTIFNRLRIEARITGRPVAAQAVAGPRAHLLIAVLADHVGRDGLGIHPRHLLQPVLQPRRIESRAGAQHMSLRQSQNVVQPLGDDVAGVRNVHQHTLKAAGLQPLRITVDGMHVKGHFRESRVRVLQRDDVAHAVHDHVPVAQVLDLPQLNLHPMGQKFRAIQHVLSLGGRLCPLLRQVHQDNVFGQALRGNRMEHMGAHMSETNDTKLEITHFHFLLLSYPAKPSVSHQ